MEKEKQGQTPKVIKAIGKRLKEPTTWASITALVAIFKPEWAHLIGPITAILGVGLPEGQVQP